MQNVPQGHFHASQGAQNHGVLIIIHCNGLFYIRVGETLSQQWCDHLFSDFFIVDIISISVFLHFFCEIISIILFYEELCDLIPEVWILASYLHSDDTTRLAPLFECLYLVYDTRSVSIPVMDLRVERLDLLCNHILWEFFFHELGTHLPLPFAEWDERSHPHIRHHRLIISIVYEELGRILAILFLQIGCHPLARWSIPADVVRETEGYIHEKKLTQPKTYDTLYTYLIKIQIWLPTLPVWAHTPSHPTTLVPLLSSRSELILWQSAYTEHRIDHSRSRVDRSVHSWCRGNIKWWLSRSELFLFLLRVLGIGFFILLRIWWSIPYLGRYLLPLADITRPIPLTICIQHQYKIPISHREW